MNHNLNRFLCLSAALSTAAACVYAQFPDSATPDATSTTATPVAWVYVSYAPDIKVSNTHRIAGFKACANGSMTVITGSPFNDDVSSIPYKAHFWIAAGNSAAY